jgi:hypothetical protein
MTFFVSLCQVSPCWIWLRQDSSGHDSLVQVLSGYVRLGQVRSGYVRFVQVVTGRFSVSLFRSGCQVSAG